LYPAVAGGDLVILSEAKDLGVGTRREVEILRSAQDDRRGAREAASANPAGYKKQG